MTTTQTTGKAPTKLQQEAMALFGVASVDKISTVLWALGIRRACGRCGGSGHYSRNSMGDTRCYDCKGKKEAAAKLTRETLDAARAKVEGGELEALREQGRARAEARKMIAVKIAAAETICAEIGEAYTAGSNAVDRMRDESKGALSAFVSGPVYRAQVLKNALVYSNPLAVLNGDSSRVRPELGGMGDIRRAVEFHGLDPVKACVLLDERAAMLTELRDAWRTWNAAQRDRLRAGAHARLAA